MHGGEQVRRDGEAYSTKSVRRWKTTEFKAVSWEEVKLKAVTDDLCVRLKELIQRGFPENRAEVEDDLKSFLPLRDDLYLLEGVPMVNNQMFTPPD